MIFDDERTARDTVAQLIRTVYGVHRIETEDNIFSLSLDLAINQPKLLILDYLFEGGVNLDLVMPSLRKFDGTCVIFSGADLKRIRQELGDIPPNFHIVAKGNFKALRLVLDRYLS